MVHRWSSLGRDLESSSRSSLLDREESLVQRSFVVNGFPTPLFDHLDRQDIDEQSRSSLSHLRNNFPPKKSRWIWESIAPLSSKAKRFLMVRNFSFCLQYNRCSLPLDRRNLMAISLVWLGCWTGTVAGRVLLVEEKSPVDFCFRRCFFNRRRIGLWRSSVARRDVLGWVCVFVVDDDDEVLWLPP